MSVALVREDVNWPELDRGKSVNPVALRLVDLPVVRAVQKLESKDIISGRLPVHAYTAQLEGRQSDGSLYRVAVKGDDRLGLPYGADGDILFALFKVADELPEAERRELLVSGEFRDPSVGMIARAMGKPMNGETSKRIRDALHRLAHVRIEMHMTHVAQEVGAAIMGEAGQSAIIARPLEPDGGPVSRVRKPGDTTGVLHVLEYAVSRTYDRRESGEDWIAHLQINPIWLREMAAGWAAWINVGKYVALRSPIAKRLYQLFAGEAARGVAAPWCYDLGDLQQRCGTVGVSRRPAAIRSSIEEASAELRGAEIIGSVEWAKVGHGRYSFAFSPGAELRAATLLRGVGALDSRELRVHRMLLRYFGVTRAEADRMLSERPSRVHEALQYLLYVRETDRTRVTRSWPAYLAKLVDGDANFAGDVRYQKWLSLRTAGKTQSVTAGDAYPPVVHVASETERHATLDARRATPINSEAVDLWTDVRERAIARYPVTHAAYVEDLAAFDVSGDELTCISSTPFTLRKLESFGLGPLEQELRTASEGRVTRIRLEAFDPVRHEVKSLPSAE